MTYTIKEFAALFHTTEHTVRYYTDIGLLPCRRDGGNRRVFDETSYNWMQGITCLKGCGATLEDIKGYCALCKLPSNRANLLARQAIILRQRAQAYQRLEEAQAVVAYMEGKVRHYEDVLNGVVPDDTNPAVWTEQDRPVGHR